MTLCNAPLGQLPAVMDAAQVAELLRCSVKTVEDWARRGALPGLKPSGCWVFPAGALAVALDALAAQQAGERQAPKPSTACFVGPAPGNARGRKRRTPPTLPDLRGLPIR